MSYPTQRMSLDGSQPRRPPSMREPVEYGWAQRSNSLAAAAVVLRSALDATPNSSSDERFAAEVRLYEEGHWEQAFTGLASLADQGHATAARLALLMLRYGASLYGTAFSAAPDQVARWAQRVLRATSRATASPRSITAIA
jgi:hypothetical protein